MRQAQGEAAPPRCPRCAGPLRSALPRRLVLLNKVKGISCSLFKGSIKFLSRDFRFPYLDKARLSRSSVVFSSPETSFQKFWTLWITL